jgi:hypothetical protein
VGVENSAQSRCSCGDVGWQFDMGGLLYLFTWEELSGADPAMISMGLDEFRWTDGRSWRRGVKVAVRMLLLGSVIANFFTNRL